MVKFCFIFRVKDQKPRPKTNHTGVGICKSSTVGCHLEFGSGFRSKQYFGRCFLKDISCYI